MTPVQLARVRELLDRVGDRSGSDLQAVLDRECSDDGEVRSRVEELLREDRREPAADVIPPVPDPDQAPTGNAPRGRSSATGAALCPPGASPSLEGTSVSHYLVGPLLGSGGMGDVFLAEDRALGRTVALKVLQPEFSSPMRQRLRREASVSARLQHPGIATFYEAGEAGGVDFIAMEFVEGQTLRQHLDRGPLPVEQALDVAEQVLEALDHAHSVGILHRDLKPSNLMRSADGRVKLLDFGLAKALAGGPAESAARDRKTSSPEAERAELTESGTFVGTPGYLAPEQVSGDTLDARVDLFALGAVLYEMLGGRAAFPGRTFAERIDALRRTPPPPLADPHIRAPLNRLLERLLARHPAGRFSSAREVLLELRGLRERRARRIFPLAVAVADFEDLSQTALDGDLAAGVGDALCAALGRLPELRPLRSPRQPPAPAAGDGSVAAPDPLEAARRQGAALAVSGSIAASESGVRIEAEVRDVATGALLLEESAPGDVAGVTALADRLPVALAALLELEPPESEQAPVDPEALQRYLRGRRLVLRMERGSLEDGRRELEEAVRLAPAFAPALATLTGACSLAYNFTCDRQALLKALEYGRRAVAAAPAYAEGHWRLGYALTHAGRHAEAHRELEEAVRLDPTDFLAAYLAAGNLGVNRRRIAQELGPAAAAAPAEIERQVHELAQRAVRLNPRFVWGWLQLGWIHVDAHRFAEALWCLERAVELEPSGRPALSGVAGYLGEALRRAGRLDEARGKLMQGLSALESRDHVYRDTFRGFFLCGLGRTALEQGDAAAAEAAFHQAVLHVRGRMRARCGGHVLVQALAGRSRATGAAEALEEAVELFERRPDLDFTMFWGLTDDDDRVELARAAGALGQEDRARDLGRRAVDAGSPDAPGDSPAG